MSIVTHPADLSAAELLQRYASRDLSPVEVLDAVLDRVARLDPVVNAFRHVDADGAREQARASEARWARASPRGSLDGVPVAFKDLLHVQGWPTRMGSLATSDAPQAEDCPAAARLREHGAVLLASPKAGLPASRAIRGTRAARPAAAVAELPLPRRWGWACCMSPAMAAGPSVPRRRRAACSASSRVSGVCHAIRRRIPARSSTSVPWHAR
ncbi:Acylamidase [compost metagenome]